METLESILSVGQAHPDLAILTAFASILVGAGSMPLLVVLTRYVASVLINELISTLRGEFIKWLHVALALALGFAAVPAPAVEITKPAVSQVVDSGAPSAPLVAAMIDAFARVTAVGSKPIPAWVMDLGVRLYTAYRVYQIGKKADRVAALALAALNENRTEVEARRLRYDGEQQATRMRIEALAVEMETLNGRVTAVEKRAQRIDRRPSRLRAW